MEQGNEIVGLHERRRRLAENGTVNFSQIRRPRPSVRTDIGKRLSTARLSPPETPMSPGSDGQAQEDQHSLFHNYLRAFCHFDPPASGDESDEALLMTASIRPGDLILVHSIHKNGWADGTVLTTGARGWLPTNYCETFDHPHLRNLLNAMTQFWDLLGAPEDATLSTFVRQDYVRGLIAGVRYLLEQSDCLHRDAILVQRHAGIRRMRKGLLADLATLVQIAKRLQETISEPFAGEVVHVLLDDLVAKAFRVVTRAVGFVDMLAQETVGTAVQRRSPAREPSDSRKQAGALEIRIRASINKGITAAIDSAIDFPLTPPREDSTQAKQSTSGEIDAEIREATRSPTFRPPSGLLAHRLSVVKPHRTQKGTLASEKLAKAHDECISQIGAFIGLYLHSRPSSELIATTERLVESCETLLSILDRVNSHDTQQQTSLQQARSNFQQKLDELTKSTRDVFKFSDSPDDDVVMLPDQTTHLVNVGTSLIRTVGECVVKARKLIEQLGDFDLQQQPIVDTKEDEESDGGHNDAKAGARENEHVEEPEQEKTSPTIVERRLSSKPLPPNPPFLRERAMTSTGVTDFALQPPNEGSAESSPLSPFPSISHSSLPPPRRTAFRSSGSTASTNDGLKSPPAVRTSSVSPARKCSVGTSIAGSTDTHQSSIRDSGITTVSEVSTRATTPEQGKESSSPNSGLINSFSSVTSLRSAAGTDASGDFETIFLQKTYANELTFNKDGQVSGGSLPALVEQLTTHDIAPDPQFVSAFFITFRSFAAPRELAQALIHRFEYVGESKTIGTPARLRIYNVFKGWLEIYWKAGTDRDALGDIRYFALHKLKPHLPQAGERLVELTRKVTSGYSSGNMTGPLVSGVGKVSMSIGSQYDNESSAPEPIVTKSQLSSLRNASATSRITDFDPLEVARQLTILASKTFCEIQPDELLSLDWNKKDTTQAPNVRLMCILNTDLAHVVGDTILGPDDAKKRAAVIKHWSKIAQSCLELSNYDSLMAIMCSLNSSVVQRLKRTWEVVSKNTKARLEELNQVVDFSRNHASLRSRLEKPVAPCLPFLGIYLTDLTFVDAGNPKIRELPGVTTESGEAMTVINFDKHMRMAKIIGHLQKFQVPYKLNEVPEMQSWMQSHLERMRAGNHAMVGHLHRRSLVIEPKDIKALKVADVRRNAEPDVPEERPKTAGTDTIRTVKSVKTTVQPKQEGQNFQFFFRTNMTFKTRTEGGTTDGGDRK